MEKTKGLKKRILEYLLFTISIIVLDLVFHIIVINRLNVYLPLEITFILLMSSPIFMFKHNFLANVYSTILYCIVITLITINLELYNASNDIFTFKYLVLFNETRDVMSSDFLNLGYILFVGIFTIVYFILLFIINVHIESSEYKVKKPFMYSLVMISLLSLVRCICFDTISNNQKDNELYKNLSGDKIVLKSSSLLKTSSIYNYGFLNYSLADIVNQFGNNYYIEDDETNYLDKDLLTGVCKGYNVVEIMIETGTNSVVNETLTPNLYNLTKEGITFNNNYSKNKTNISEFIGICGSVTTGISNYSSYVPYSLATVLNKFDYTTSFFHANRGSFYNRSTIMPNLGFDMTYLNKTESDTLSTDNITLIDGFDFKDNYNGRYPFDSNYYDKVRDYFIPSTDTPFYTFWTTLSTHGPYNYSDSLNTYYSDYYVKLKKAESDGKWVNVCSRFGDVVSNQFAEYQCKMMVFDDALGELIEDLKAKDLYDNTIFVLYGDHDCYYNVDIDNHLNYYIFDTFSNYTKDEHLEYYAKEYETYMTISNPTLIKNIKNNIDSLTGFSINNGNVEYNYFTSPYVIVPTLLDILGIKYNTDYYVGNSIFQNNDIYSNIFYSHELNYTFSNDLLSNGDNIVWQDNVSDENIEKFNKALEKLLSKIDKFNVYYNNKYFDDETRCNKIIDSFNYF